MDLTSHSFEWSIDRATGKWAGFCVSYLKEDYIWYRLQWPVRLVVRRLRNMSLKLPPDVEDEERPDGVPRNGLYVPPTVLFTLVPTALSDDEESSFSGKIYLPADKIES